MSLGTAAGAAVSPVVSNTLRDANTFPSTSHYVISSPTEAECRETEERLHELKDYVKFKTISMSKDPLNQGFQRESFDVIIVSALEGAQDLDKQLEIAKMILKPGGKLCIIGISSPGLTLSLILHCLQAIPR